MKMIPIGDVNVTLMRTKPTTSSIVHLRDLLGQAAVCLKMCLFFFKKKIPHHSEITVAKVGFPVGPTNRIIVVGTALGAFCNTLTCEM